MGSPALPFGIDTILANCCDQSPRLLGSANSLVLPFHLRPISNPPLLPFRPPLLEPPICWPQTLLLNTGVGQCLAEMVWANEEKVETSPDSGPAERKSTVQNGKAVHCVGTKRVGHPYQSRTPASQKKARTSFTKAQIVVLERRFSEQKYLASADRIPLSVELDMQDAQVKTWFQNRRTKWRRQEAEERQFAHKMAQLGGGEADSGVGAEQTHH